MIQSQPSPQPGAENQCVPTRPEDGSEELLGLALIALPGGGRRGELEIAEPRRSGVVRRWSPLGEEPRTFAIFDYTPWAAWEDRAEGSLEIAPGSYLAQLLPPGREKRLFQDADDLQIGKNGALVLTPESGDRVFCSQPPIIVHSGAPTTTNVRWIRSLIMAPADLDVVLGTLVGIRRWQLLGFPPAAYLPWKLGAALLQGLDDAQRRILLQPHRVLVERRRRTLLQAIFGGYGRTVPAPSPVDSERELGPILATPEELHTAQATAGFKSLDYLRQVMDLTDELKTVEAELNKVLALRDPAQRRTRIQTLTPRVRDMIVRLAATAQGMRDDISAGFLKDDGSWSPLLALLDRKIQEMRDVHDADLDAALFAGIVQDTGAAWSFVAPAPPRAACDLSAVTLQIPPTTLKRLKLPITGLAHFYFVQIAGPRTEYRLNASLRANVDRLRALHRTLAGAEVARRPNSCSERWHLRQTDETVNRAGEILTKAMVRADIFACASFKYPCGVSLRGTKSCTHTMKTKLFSLTEAFMRRVTTAPADDGIQYRFDGESEHVELDDFLEELRKLSTTAGLRVTSSRFTLKDRLLGNAIELRGAALKPSVACSIARQLRSEGTI